MDLSIIIVNWNTRELLKACLLSLYETLPEIDYEVIVVDNASRDGSASMVKDDFPRVLLIENQTNRGFAAANNQALTIMRGRYALLINSDTVLTENAVSLLFSFLEDHPEAAMCCGQLLNADGSKQHSIASFPSLLTLMTNISFLEYLWPQRYPSKRYEWKKPIETDSCIGACMLVRKRAIEAVGMLDERYFFFFEETDWAYRMRTSGWKIFHLPGAFIYHLQGQSIGRNIGSRKEFYRSRYQYFRKWHGYPYFLFTGAVIVTRLLINWLSVSAANVLLLGQKKSLRDKWVVYGKLLLWHLQGCPQRRE